MTQELIGELYRRYLRGKLTLEHAAAQIFALMQGDHEDPTGLSVTTSDMDTADRERTFALFGRLKWHALRQALPEADIPPLGPQEFLPDMEKLDRGKDAE